MAGPGASDIIGFEEVTSPRIKAFYDYWVAQTDTPGLPRREEFQIENLLPWVGSILIIDVVDNGADFYHRLVGTRIAETLGRDLTGKLVSESPYSIGAEAMLERYRVMLTLPAPIYRRGQVIWARDKAWISFESITVFMSEDGETIRQLLTIVDYPEI